MRAWQVQRNGPPCDVLRLAEISEPVPGPGELRLLVQAAAVGMPDAFLCRGTYAFNPTLPFVPGQEVCGIVDAVGTDVRIALGTRVMAVTNFYDGRGGFAEVAIARADACYRVPETMSDVDAASFRIGFSTAWIGLVRRAALQAGETLLVLGGAGGSGVAAIQLGLALGARVIAVAAGAAKCNVCAQLGADVVIDRATQVVPVAVLEASGGLGVDVVYDPVGGNAAGATLRCLTRGGRLLAVGFASGEWVLADIMCWRVATRPLSGCMPVASPAPRTKRITKPCSRWRATVSSRASRMSCRSTRCPTPSTRSMQATRSARWLFGSPIRGEHFGDEGARSDEVLRQHGGTEEREQRLAHFCPDRRT